MRKYHFDTLRRRLNFLPILECINWYSTYVSFILKDSMTSLKITPDKDMNNMLIWRKNESALHEESLPQFLRFSNSVFH